jgi:hypothetical protein
VPTISDLYTAEELAMNAGDTADNPSVNADGSYTIVVRTTNKCPRGNTYTTYMGTSVEPGWTTN